MVPDDDKPDDRDSWWELDETIPLLIHEGFFSGDELREYGINGIETLDYVSARVEVIGGRTIRAQLLRMPGGAERTYFGSPFMKIGSNLLGVSTRDIAQTLRRHAARRIPERVEVGRHLARARPR